jgi:threonine/homoserine/homoserine lactone efflux protein
MTASLLTLVAATLVLVAIPGPNVTPGLVAGVILLVLMFGDLLWAAFATSARPLLLRYSGACNRLSGAFLVTTGVGLALAPR